MGKVITLTLAQLEDDHTPLAVNLEIKDEDSNALLATTPGYLPPIGSAGIRDAYNKWKEIYQVLDPLLFRAAHVPSSRSYNIHDLKNQCKTAAQSLLDQMAKWLATSGPDWQPVRDEIIRCISDSSEEIRVLIKTNDTWLQKLPWQKWNLLPQNTWNAEVGLSLTYSQSIKTTRKTASGQVRILVVLGNSEGLDLESDGDQFRGFIDGIEILSKPSPRELLDHLRNEDGWDLFFFSGHSSSPDLDKGILDGEFSISPGVNISITDFRNAFQDAIHRGLKVGIFNSCDGLGLANALMKLNIPQVVVMRELIPDPAARQFLADFLSYYSNDNSLYSSVRQAKEKLESLEVNNPGVGQFPGVSWLPVICQNPTEKPPTWNDLRRGGRYVDSVVDILERKGAVHDNRRTSKLPYKGLNFERVLRMSGAEMNIDPFFSLAQMKGEWNFIFTSFKRLDIKKVTQYSQACFEYCKNELWPNKLSSNNQTRGFGLGLKVPANICFAIVLVDKIDEQLKREIQETNSLEADEIYSNACFEYSVPIVYVNDENRIYYFRQSSAWLNGEAAWRCIRPVIKKYLNP